MSDYKLLLGSATIVIGLVSYLFYFRDIFANKTKPEAYSWFIWGLLAAITFFAQITKGAGPGAWATALTGVACIMIGITALYRGDGTIKFIDVVSLAGAFTGLALWRYTHDPLFAVILVIMVGALGFVPTFRKAYRKPREESAITFALNAVKFAVALFALGSVNPVTALYPVALIAMNVSLAIMILRRRSAEPPALPLRQ